MQTFRNVLFVPHGSPTFALNAGAAGAAMSEMVQKLPTPRAIVVVSPHWDTRIPTVSVATQLETIHDFYGFPEALYKIQYPATGCPEVAQEVTTALRNAGMDVDDSSQHGLDHGAWHTTQGLPQTMTLHGMPNFRQAISRLQSPRMLWSIVPHSCVTF